MNENFRRPNAEAPFAKRGCPNAAPAMSLTKSTRRGGAMSLTGRRALHEVSIFRPGAEFEDSELKFEGVCGF